MSEIQRDAIKVQPASPQDANERRALLLHFGDVVESIGCVLKCAELSRGGVMAPGMGGVMAPAEAG